METTKFMVQLNAEYVRDAKYNIYTISINYEFVELYNKFHDMYLLQLLSHSFLNFILEKLKNRSSRAGPGSSAPHPYAVV